MGRCRISFHGAAQTVTGSKYLLEANGSRILIDCGLFQGLKELRLLNWSDLPFAAESIKSILLTHAHLDHTGYLPRLVKDGFECPVYSTRATGELTRLILSDSARIQMEDARHANRKGYSKHSPALPLYDTAAANQAVRQLRARDLGDWFEPAPGISARFHDAGHLLGSSMIEVHVDGGRRPLRLLFSGDVGRYDAPLYFDPSPPPECDYLICESTYGNREHSNQDLLEELAQEVRESIQRGGIMLIASFAVGRAQQLIYLLQTLMAQERIPEVEVYLDSPMAVDATEIYCQFQSDHDLSESELLGPSCVLFGPKVHLVRSRRDSRRINQVKTSAVVISSSGMMTAGRILHHLRQRLPDHRNTIVLGGYSAAGTRARLLKDGAISLKMHGQQVPVKAKVTEISGLSGHAGRSELLRWSSPLAPPRLTFLTHGERESASSLAQHLQEARGWETVVPQLNQAFDLEAPQ